MAKILEYQVHYKYNPGETQQVEKLYTPEAARKFAASVELWGGVTVIMEEMIDEDDLNGIH